MCHSSLVLGPRASLGESHDLATAARDEEPSGLG